MNKNSKISSRYRAGYLIQICIQTLVVVLLNIPFLYLMFFVGLTAKGILICIGIITFLVAIPILFALRLIFRLHLSRSDITVSYLYRSRRFGYNDISKISLKKHSLKQRFYPSPGYEILVIKLEDGYAVEISENVYANYRQIKMRIYENLDEHRN